MSQQSHLSEQDLHVTIRTASTHGGARPLRRRAPLLVVVVVVVIAAVVAATFFCRALRSSRSGTAVLLRGGFFGRARTHARRPLVAGARGRGGRDGFAAEKGREDALLPVVRREGPLARGALNAKGSEDANQPAFTTTHNIPSHSRVGLTRHEMYGSDSRALARALDICTGHLECRGWVSRRDVDELP